ncbi:hypothetical protein AJ80_00456 [Polytolypa hystricis UAMH7299]|uniref:SGNH hydrolase-type esterase domain-containing protein n=1 Tax=Polytolypa hystricis (strain UAMH7299) TaxID=1447883 RepID=A0A2B7Z1U2_POLH7|nr:hypothetical protein AJ80_00456 [Polytolypa hystricis UAMH7299]
MKGAMYFLSVLYALHSGTAAAATVYLPGDSTMAPRFQWSGCISVQVSNYVISDCSACSFIHESCFNEIANMIQPSNFVVIEFTHNDSGSLRNDNSCSNYPGTGSETCQTVYNGVQETVLTFNAYLKNAVHMFFNKGIKVII